MRFNFLNPGVISYILAMKSGEGSTDTFQMLKLITFFPKLISPQLLAEQGHDWRDDHPPFCTHSSLWNDVLFDLIADMIDNAIICL